ncbi:hypothetical protein GE115_07750 [Agromyces sp. CFH 90414]|uniref:Uncharacterized protein n=1 Tax=Agromyces agglutinans TaxID=2662258 RepID=A0A6I2FAL0_9MICO|nr:hypothetical protein [Agromyces agglutinans]MRG59760.1 hypothetical protein [Agromyces agglutinans]
MNSTLVALLPAFALCMVLAEVKYLMRARLHGDAEVRAVLAVAGRVGMTIDRRELGDRIGGRLRRQGRAMAFAAPFVAVPGIVAAFWMPADTSGAVFALPLWIVIACMQFTESSVAVAEGFRLDPDRPRVANARRRTRADYADPVVRIGTRVFVLLAAAISVVAVFSIGAEAALLGLTALLAIAALVVAELLAQSLAGHPQHARDDDELRWDDALRALAINDLYVAPFGLAGLAMLSSGLAAAASTNSALWPLSFVTPIALLAALVIGLVRRPAHRAVRRLWPEAAGA